MRKLPVRSRKHGKKRENGSFDDASGSHEGIGGNAGTSENSMSHKRTRNVDREQRNNAKQNGDSFARIEEGRGSEDDATEMLRPSSMFIFSSTNP